MWCKSKVFSYVSLILASFVLIGCSQFGDTTQMLGGQVSATQVQEAVIDVGKLKKAYQESSKAWSDAKKAYARNSKILTKSERESMTKAAATVDEALNGIQSVRGGNTVDKAIVLLDLQKMQPRFVAATETFKSVLDAHKAELNAAEVTQYAKVIEMLNVLNLKKFSSQIDAKQNLLDLINMIRELGDVLKGVRLF